MSRRRTVVEPNIVKVLIALAILLGIGTFFYAHAEGWSYFDALYFSVTTLTTIGYGDLHPTHTISKVFTMIYILVGVGSLLFALSVITQKLIESQRKMINKAEEIAQHLEKEEEQQEEIILAIEEKDNK